MKSAGRRRSPHATICALLISGAAGLACAKPAEGPAAREPAPEPAPSAPQTVSDDGDESVVRWSLGPPASHLAAAGLVVQPVHTRVPGPGDLRKQARIAATEAVVAGTRGKPQPKGRDSAKPPAQAPARQSRQRSGR